MADDEKKEINFTEVDEALTKVRYLDSLRQADVLNLLKKSTGLSVPALKKRLSELKSGGEEWQIDWESKKPEISPELDFNNETAYTCQYLNAKNGKKVCTIITSDKQTIPLRPEETSKLPFYVDFIPQRRRGSGWSQHSIKSFLDKTDPVSFKDVFDSFDALRRKYMWFWREEYYTLETIYDMATYFFPLFSTFPIKYINSVKGAGKTRDLTISSALAFGSHLAATPRETALFRSGRSTILIDEIKHMHSESEENIKILLKVRYKKGLAVPRYDKDSKVMEWYDVFGPLILANIKGIEEDIEDKAIKLTFRRAQNMPQITNVDPEFMDACWQEARDKAFINMMTKWQEVKKELDIYASGIAKVEAGRGTIIIGEGSKNDNAEPQTEKNQGVGQICLDSTLPSTINSRELELWKPLLVLSKLVSDKAYEDVLLLAKESSTMERSTMQIENTDAQIVRGLLEKVEGVEVNLTTHEILSHLKYRFFPNSDDWLTPSFIGKALRRIDSSGKVVRPYYSQGKAKYQFNKHELEEYAKTIPLDPDEVRKEYHEMQDREKNERPSEYYARG